MLVALVVGIVVFGGVSFVFADEQTTTTPPKKTTTAFDPACIQSAIETRDTAIIAAFDKFHAAAKSALETRKTALKEAWAKPTWQERKTAVKAAWAAYSKALKEARTTFKQEKKDAWKQFHSNRVNCKNKEVNKVEGGVKEGADGNL